MFGVSVTARVPRPGFPHEPARFGFGQEEKRLRVLPVSRLPRPQLPFVLSG